MQWRGREVVFAIIVFSFLVPEEVVAVPLSAIVAGAGLQNTYIALIMPFVGNGIVIFLLRQFFLAIPRSLIEAAQVDGAGWLRIFLEVSYRFHVRLSSAPASSSSMGNGRPISGHFWSRRARTVSSPRSPSALWSASTTPTTARSLRDRPF
ncbi:ABC transporter permease subunit [Mesorhizobium sp. M0601]|uniref:ABC transporter permease subunit n=1 Tax=Mesorhizobium sp. M0601 TaxID=2956969 RepID=UPI0033364FA6